MNKIDLEIKEEDLSEVTDFTEDELNSDDFDWKSKAEERTGIAKRRTTQLKKAKELIEAQKAELEALKPKDPPKKTKSDDKLSERLDTMALKIAGIKEADELELFNNWKEQTGREADDIVGNNIFNKELEELRTAKATLQATSDVKGGSDQSGGAKTTADYWIAKATKGEDGKIRLPAETPKELYSKILDKLSAGETKSSDTLSFYNS